MTDATDGPPPADDEPGPDPSGGHRSSRGGRRSRPRGGDAGHSHAQVDPAVDAVANPSSPLVRGGLIAAVVAVLIGTVAGLFAIWPGDDGAELPENFAVDRVRVELTAVEACPGEEGCLLGTADLDGDEIEIRLPIGDGAPEFSVGDRVVAAPPVLPEGTPEPETPLPYAFNDVDRSIPIGVLLAVFVAAVVLLSRWKGLLSLIGLVFSLVVVVQLVVPGLLAGRDPVVLALVAASLVMTVLVYGTHGISYRSSVALLGTLGALVLAAVAGWVVVGVSSFTGYGDDTVMQLYANFGNIDIGDLLLAGLIIGALGVLDDITVTQTSAVWEIAAADPTASRRSVFTAAMRVGRDHVSATVNTLVLAYVGASLPLLLLIVASETPLLDAGLSDQISQEIVRALAGSLGIIAAVPITTALACAVVDRSPAARRPLVEHRPGDAAH